MGHLMSTINPQAVERVEERPLPDIGDIVLYYPRPGERRRGRDKVSALVVHRDERNRRLDLAIFHEANDVLDQQNVPERIGDDRGWLRKDAAPWASALATATPIEPLAVTALQKEIGEVRDTLAAIEDKYRALMAGVFGDIEPPKESVLEMLGILDNAIDEIEAKVIQPAPTATTAPPTFKRRGRPPKNPPKVA